MSTLSLVKKGFNNLNAPQLLGADYRTGSKEFWLFNQSGGIDYKFSYSGYNSALKAYEKCAPLTAVINKKAQAYINGKTWILNKQGKAKEKESTNEVAIRIRKLLAKPNPIQNWKQFEAQNYIYQQLFGYCIVLPIKPVGFDNTEATQLWNIPPPMVDIEETEKLFYNDSKNIVKKIIIKYKNETGSLNPEDVFIFKDFTPSFKSLVLPESRICSLEMQINNIIGSYESRGILIDFRGAQGIVSPDAKDAGGPIILKDEDKTAIQDDYLKYGLRRGQWQLIFSTASIKFERLSIPTKDLMLFEEIEDDIMRICDGYNWQYALMASIRTSSLGGNQINEAKKVAYQDSVLPESENMYEQWQQFFELDKYLLKIEKDFSHVACLQDDEKIKAEVMKTRNEGMQIGFLNNAYTINEWRIANGDDPLTSEFADKYYYELVQMGLSFGKSGMSLSDLSGNNNNQTTTAPAA